MQDTTDTLIEEPAPEEVQERKPRGLAAILGKLDSASEKGMNQVLFNLPFVLFLVLLAVIHIFNNHAAENTARKIAATEKEVKQLRWESMTTASRLMLISKQSEVNKLVEPQGLKELRQPPHIIEVRE